MKLIVFIAVISFYIIPDRCLAQLTDSNSVLQDSLGKLSSAIWKQKSESGRLAASSIFFEHFQKVLQSSSSTLFPLDSVPGITRAASEDGKIRIFTWNVPLADGTNKYFGFIHINNITPVLIPLQSAFYDVNDFPIAKFTSQNWYGALYYKLIEVNTGDKTFYTLLGWDGFTKEANRKIIDVISFDQDSQIIFGMPVFKTESGVKSRVVFEYADKANMLLRYDYQAIRVQKRNKIKKENAWLIVMDRLVPMDLTLKDLRKYYVPAGDTYDGYIFRDNNWVLVEDIEVGNKEKQQQ